MSCRFVYNFISGTRITLAAPPCHTDEETGEPEGFFDIVRPSDQAREMVEQHLQALAAIAKNDEDEAF